MRRPRTTTLDPSLLDRGSIGAQTASFDRYFYSGEADEVLSLVLNSFVERLEEPIRASVQMCLMQGIPYSEAADTISGMRGRKTDPKTVWRWAQQGKKRIAKMLYSAPWTSEITKIPRGEHEQDESQGDQEGNVGGQVAELPWFHGSEVPEPVSDPRH